MTLHEILRRYKTITLQGEAVTVILENKPELLQKNKDQLMDEGIDSEGKKLRQYKDPDGPYARKKNRMNPFPGLGQPDLSYTGDFQEGMVLQMESKTKTKITSTNSKTASLVKKYGDKIFGFTKHSREEIWSEVMKPGLVIQLNKKLRGGL